MTKNKNPNQNPSPRRRLSHVRLSAGATFRAGAGGVRIVYPDGNVVAYPSHMVFTIEGTPRRIDGLLYRVKASGALAYEAPTFDAC